MFAVRQINQIVNGVVTSQTFWNDMMSVLANSYRTLFGIINYLVIPFCVFGVVKHVCNLSLTVFILIYTVFNKIMGNTMVDYKNHMCYYYNSANDGTL